MKDSRYVNWIFFLSLFPYFRIIPIGNIEVEPLGTIVAAVYLVKTKRIFINRNSPIVYKVAILFLYVMTGYFLVSLSCWLFGVWKTPSYSFESMLIIVSPLLVFMAMYEKIPLVSPRLLKWSLISWAMLGIAQAYAAGILRMTGIASLLNVLISRFSVTGLTAIHRGVDMFAPEPSYAAYNILFMFLFSIFLFKTEKISGRAMLFNLIVILFMVYLNKSGTLLMLLALSGVLAFFRILTNVRGFAKYVFVSALCVIGFLGVTQIHSRSVVILNTVFSAILNGDMSITQALDISQQYGSSRFLSVVAGYHNMFTIGGMGTGMGSWAVDMADVMQRIGMSSMFVGNAKPYAYVALVAFDTGILGFVLITAVFLTLIVARRKMGRFTIFSVVCLGISLFCIYLDEPTSLPLFWLSLLLFYHDRYAKSRYNSTSSYLGVRLLRPESLLRTDSRVTDSST